MTSDGHGAPAGFINYPTPKAHEIPYVTPPTPKNPVIRGTTLQYLAAVATTVPFIPTILYNNAGFNSLRGKRELDNIEVRHDPTVIKVASPSDEAVASYTNVSSLRVQPKDTNGRFYTVADFHDAYKSGAFTPTDVVEALLPLVRRDVESRAPHSTAFTESKAELVRAAGEASTKRWREGKPLGILDGVPFAVKDEMDVKGYKRYIGTTRDYTNGNEVETSWCAKKLEEEGAVMMGKLSMHELGMDTTNNNPNWGTPRNPYNEQYYTGGSSGGAAYAVASGLIPFAIGSDGGGSIRIPSNYCGLFGLKPSHGRVSVAPLIKSATTTVVQGPLAGSMADLEVSYRVLAQPDPSHHNSGAFAPPRPHAGPRNKIIGICKPWFDRADPPVQEACHSAIKYLTSELGYQVIDITLPLLREGQMAHAMTILNEGLTATPDFSHLTAPNKILMKVAQQTPASDYLLAQRVRHVQMQHLAHLFRTHPGLIIVTPTTPNVGWPIVEGDLSHGVSDGNTQIRNMEYVWLANFTGVPCIQFPVGYGEPAKGKGKVPIGLSGHGEWGSEDALIEFGYDGEKWLNEGRTEGRLRPQNWVDIMGTVAKA
ncbi:glutamyl-tRNA amidotransferas-like protein subunit A [Corynespora cassiicola Philippines]|uniref:Glutamyl-tRNA amidotransferas-like protein subunit A n=1 Tax=Corynespora cassiicola Philippines TaxID=1448308 RepID=A0A2T2P1X5_CORCC|nr:glutamyl-tRNA amidotransferas-like protein subunit A [Corynespora cassiicola Philippines]